MLGLNFFRWVQRVVVFLPLLATNSGNALSQPGVGIEPGAQRFLLSEANRDRAAHNLATLTSDPQLTQAALYHAVQMADHAAISHGFPGEPDLSERGANAGVRFSLITENVAEAQDAAIIHDLWMNSTGHRANLLDPAVNAVGIAVVIRDHEVFAVEDFASTTEILPIEEQEARVANVLESSGLKITARHEEGGNDARRVCEMGSSYPVLQQPWLVVKYRSIRLDELPKQLVSRLRAGKYQAASVGACGSSDPNAFNLYNIAVLLYP